MKHPEGRDGDDITPLPPLHLDRGDGGSPAPDDDERASWRTGRFQLYNAGPHAVDVLGVALPGWTRATNQDATRPVTAEPGTWVTVTAGFDIDCASEPDRRIDVTVRTPAGERTVEVEAPPINDQMRWAWDAGCNDNLHTFVDVTLMDVVSRDADRMVIEAEIHLPGRQTVTTIVSEVPGFTVTAPTPIDAEGSMPLELTWQLSDCERASAMRDGALTVTLLDDDTPADPTVQASLDPGLLVELARFAVAACES